MRSNMRFTFSLFMIAVFFSLQLSAQLPPVKVDPLRLRRARKEPPHVRQRKHLHARKQQLNSYR